MKALITYTTEKEGQKSRIEEITTLNQVIELAVKEGESVIIILEKYNWNIKEFGDYDIELEVYNDYRE